LATILHEIETGESYLFVATLSIREPQRQLRRDEPDGPPQPDIVLDRYGYMRGPTA
jgi:hypothetical protein